MKSKTKECLELVRVWLKMNKIQLEEVPVDDGVVFRGREKLLSGIAPICSRTILVDDNTVACSALLGDYVKEPFRKAVAEYFTRVNVDYPSCKLSLDMDDGTIWSSCTVSPGCVVGNHAVVLFWCHATALQNLDRWLPGVMLIQERGCDAKKAYQRTEEWDDESDLVPNKKKIAALSDAEKYKMAVELAKEFGVTTPGFLSARLCISYFEAAALIDQMQKHDVVAASDGVGHDLLVPMSR